MKPIDGYTLRELAEITAVFLRGRRLFLFERSDYVQDKSEDADDHKGERKKVLVCNVLHTHHPLMVSRGQEPPSRKRGRYRLPL